MNECEQDIVLYYYIDYTEMAVSDDCFYFHAQWRRENPTAGNMDLAALRPRMICKPIRGGARIR